MTRKELEAWAEDYMRALCCGQYSPDIKDALIAARIQGRDDAAEAVRDAESHSALGRIAALYTDEDAP